MLWHAPALRGRLADKLSQRLIHDLAQTPPALLVTIQRVMSETPVDSPVFVWMRNHYAPVPVPLEDVFFLFGRVNKNP